MSNKNADIRKEARIAGVYLWQIAAYMGISEPTLNRWLRFALPAEKKKEIRAAIGAISAEQNSEGA